MATEVKDEKGFALNKAIRKAIYDADPIQVDSVIKALAFVAGEICVNTNPKDPEPVAEYFISHFANSVKIFTEEGA